MRTGQFLMGAVLVAAGMCVTTRALAQDKKGAAPAAAKPVAAPAPAPEGPPKPAPQLVQLEWLKGTWKCDGKTPPGAMGPGTPAGSYKSTVKAGLALDGYWFMLNYEQKKSKTHPMAIKAQGLMNWDPGANRFNAWGFDSLGGVSVVTGTFDAVGNWAASGDQIMGGKKIPYRESIIKKSDKEYTVKGEWRMGGVDWSVLFEDTCKR